MKSITLTTAALIIAGCASPQKPHQLDSQEYQLATISVLYNETRQMVPRHTKPPVQSDGGPTDFSMVRETQWYYDLIDDTNFVAATETILMHYATNSPPQAARSAALALVYFGTETALQQALEIAHTDKSPKFRAELWQAITDLLDKPKNIQILQTLPADSPESFESTLLDTIPPFYLPFPFNAIMPPQISRQELEDAIIHQYAEDDGQWTVDCVDRIPFVPFYKKNYTVSTTVRQAIAYTLSSLDNSDSPRIINAFKKFSRSPNPAISEPAKRLLNYFKLTHSHKQPE